MAEMNSWDGSLSAYKLYESLHHFIDRVIDIFWSDTITLSDFIDLCRQLGIVQIALPIQQTHPPADLIEHALTGIKI